LATTKVDVNLIDASGITSSKYLKGDGTWGTVDALPSQTSQSGKFLTTDGSDASWGAVAGGITTASQWRLTGDFTGDAVPIGDSTGVLEVCDTNGYANLGTGMTYSSGVFTFPAGGTGWWYLLGQFTVNTAANASAAGLLEYTADDGGAWTTASTSGTSNYYAFRGNINIHHLLKITDLTNQKVRWSMDADVAGHGGVVTTRGDTDITETGFTFIKLADT